MKKRLLLVFAIALCITVALPTKAQTGGLGTAQEVGGKKTLPYSFATKAIPASAMEYDSIAGCFIVRDTIVGSSTRSRAASRVETRAASTYNEGGVLYGYFGNQLSSNSMDEMHQLVVPWTAEFINLDVDSLLSPASNAETWYMQIVGVDNDDLDSRDGEMRIYNDIGTVYNYKTIAIDSTALRGNEHIKSVVFEDCASASANANTMLNMVIHDGAFKDCKNLKVFNMFYLVTAGSNHYELLRPSDVYVGKNVFEGCHEDFRIQVAPQLYDEFVNDPNWCRYADKIIAMDYLPTTYSPITHEGVVYDYAASSLNTLPTSELTRLQSSWWNAAIIGVEVAAALITYGSASAAAASAQKATQQLTSQLISQGASNEIATEMVTNMISQGSAAVSYLGGWSGQSYSIIMSKAVSKTLAKAASTRLAARIVPVATPAGIFALTNLTNTIANKARRDPSWALYGGQWVMTENKHTIYHMYVKEAPNQEIVTLYNDIGSAYNYATVGIGSTAFHNKDLIKTVQFKDVNMGEMYEDMLVVVPDQVFKGCTGLETLDLIMWSNCTNRYVPLGPENFILCGDDLFAGCDMSKLKIRIGKDKYDEFVENDAWKKYKDKFEVVDVPEMADLSVYGAQYSYSFENNSLKMQEYYGANTIEHVHVIGPDSASLTKQDGELGLFNDAGQYNNYKLDYVNKNAFNGNKTLTGISMFDLKGLAGFGDSYTELSFMLNDSAFANCPNLKYINMLYFRTDGKNSVEPMDPSRVQLGKDVFAGSDNFKVKMVTTAVDAFKADTAWAKYEDRFLPTLIITEDEILADVLKESGLQYTSPVTGGSFEVYDLMKGNINDNEFLNNFRGVEFTSFPEFKAFEHLNLTHTISTMFSDCSKLQHIELPSTLTGIGVNTFYNCVSLDDIVIPAGVTKIFDSAFQNCTRLRNVTFLSETPAELGKYVFLGLPNDYVFYVPETAVEAYKSAWPEHANHIQTVSNKQTGILEVTLSKAGTLAEKLGLGVDDDDPLHIDGNFSKYDSLKIVGPINGTDIGVIRFLGGRDVDNCEKLAAGNLKYLDLYDANIVAGGADYNQDGSNDRITEDNCIDTYMFWELDKLETLILPKSATQIKQSAFESCDNLQRLVIGDNTKNIGKNVTKDCANLREIILLCNEVPATDKNAWDENYPVETIYVPRAYSGHLMGSYVYYTRAYSMASSFEDDAVMRALAQKRIYTTDDLAKVTSADNLINGNTEVQFFVELLYAKGIKTLGDNAFNGCSKLEKVAFAGALETISAGAFNGCTSLTAVNVICDTIPGLAADAFEDLPQHFVIYVTPGEEDAYRKAWPQYADHIKGYHGEKENEIKVVTVTEPGTLGEALDFTVDMDAPDNVGRIGGDITSIKALKVIGPINGKDIAVLRMLGGREEEDGDEVILARMNYLDLYDATICTDPDNICFNRDGINDYVKNDNEVPEHMFYQLDVLETVILPKNVTKIAVNAFYDCLNIQTIVVGDATTEIGNDAFGKCKNLHDIVFLCNKKPVIDNDAFSDPITDQPYQVERMYVPGSLYDNYVGDTEYTHHTKEFCVEYAEDALFRAYGSHAVMSNDQLPEVTNIDGWFLHHNDIKDLSSLAMSSVDTLKASTLAPVAGLQKIALPATLAFVEENVFAANTKLQWVDFAECTGKDVITENNIDDLGINQYALVYAPDSLEVTGFTNVVYGCKGNLKCDHFAISDSAKYSVPREFNAHRISYDRLFTKGARSTLCLPFDMELPSGARAYMLSGQEDEILLFHSVNGVLEANKPYVVITNKDMVLDTTVETVVPVAPNRLPQVSVDNYTMTGTLAHISGENVEKQRMYTLGEDGYWTLGNKAVSPYSAYLQATRPNMPDVVNMREIVDEIFIVDGAQTEFSNLWEHVVDELGYTRTLNNTWNALYVPFQIELTGEFLANYDVAYINNVHSYDWDENGELDDWNIEIIKIKKLGKLKANHPYVIRPKNDEAMNLNITQYNTTLYSTAADKQTDVTCSSAYMQYAVKGVYSKTASADLDNGNYVYAINKNGEWQKMGLETSLIPFRLYLTMESRDGSPVDVNISAAQSIRMRLVGEESEDGTTVIYDVDMDGALEADCIYDLYGRRILKPQQGCIYIVNGKKVMF